MVEIGARVGAIQKADNEEVYLYGFGIYQGDEIPSRGYLKDMGVKNPKILLDNGQTIWGFECWWGEEEKIKRIIGERKIIDIYAR
jgi:hypothetical protein